MYNCVVCRYHEIATKGNNRNMFEQCLMDNLRHLLKSASDCKVKRVRGRIWLEHSDKHPFEKTELDNIRPALERAFGLESFSPAVLLPPDMDSIRNAACNLAPEQFDNYGKEQPSFRIRARRSNKRFPLTSNAIEIDLVSAIASVVGENRFTIDLNHAELTLGCEIRDEFALLYFNTYPAPGGLPVGSNPKVLTLLSGGIDSPVAAYMIMKRGSATDYITFHSSPYTPPETVDKVQGIAAYLNRWQRPGKLFAVNLAPLQKLIRDCCSEKMRTVLYRRAMFRIAQAVALRNHCKALVTGEALGQVASQTVVNMDTINHAVDMLVLRPLVGTDKLETIRIADHIGTLKMSEVAVPDSCTVFAPTSPSTAVPRLLAEKEELKIADYAKVLAEIVDKTEELIPDI